MTLVGGRLILEKIAGKCGTGDHVKATFVTDNIGQVRDAFTDQTASNRKGDQREIFTDYENMDLVVFPGGTLDERPVPQSKGIGIKYDSSGSEIRDMGAFQALAVFIEPRASVFQKGGLVRRTDNFSKAKAGKERHVFAFCIQKYMIVSTFQLDL